MNTFSSVGIRTLTRTFATDLLPERNIPEEIAEKCLYKPAGYGCWDCEFVTNKRVLPGKQAIRAHLKAPVNERRAWRRPLIA